MGRESTVVDNWLGHATQSVTGGQPRWLLIFTSQWLILAIALACLIIALVRRQWVLAVAVLACPFVVTVVTAALKHLFDRHNGPYLEYPSGHTALLVSVLGMMVIVAAGRPWSLATAALLSLLGMAGLVACGYHYPTDTLGAAMLATALVCGTARLTSAL